MAILQRLMDSDFGPGATVENASVAPRFARERSAKNLDKRLGILLQQTPVDVTEPAGDGQAEDKDSIPAS